MSEPMSCCPALGGYCERCDFLVGLDELHVTAVDRDDGDRLVVAVESDGDGLPGLRCRGAWSRPGRGQVGRRPGDGPAGADHLA